MNFSVGVFDLATYAIPVDTRAFWRFEHSFAGA